MQAVTHEALSQLPPSATASLICCLVTSLHEQTCASSGRRRSDAAAAGREDQLLGVGRQRDARGHHRPQHAVRRRVADQDAAEQPGAVLGDDQLLVDAGHRVGEDQLERALGGRERVAERRHVDAEQLELGRHVGAGERARAAEDRVDHHLGHRVAGRDQAVHPAGRGRALADRPDVAGPRCGTARRPGRRRARPASSPAARASASRGRMPAEKTTRSRSSGSASRRASPVTRSSPRIRSVTAPVCTVSPSPSTCRASVAPPASSTCTAISRGAISTTCVSRPRPRRALAASRPSSPPPITAPVRAPCAASRIASRSSMVR